jgi:nitronate monooxygenase
VGVILDDCELPIVLAPLAGGPATPELTAAVSNAGGLGFIAAGYLTAGQLADAISATRALTGKPYGINLFVPSRPSDPAGLAQYAELVAAEAASVDAQVGLARPDDDDWDAKLALLAADPPPVVSFTFGLPDASIVRRLQAAGAQVWLTAGTVAEAVTASELGVDALVVQGVEAGGHRGGLDDDPAGAVGLLALLQLVAARVRLPLIASGGIATGAAVAAVLSCGARAAALGTAFLDCPEAGTAAVHREALHGDAATAYTRAFTGRTARGIRNGFLDRHSAGAPSGYPEVHHLTAPMRRAARAAGVPDLVNLWAGQAYPLSRSVPAGELVHALAAEARDALARAAARLPESLSSDDR